MSIPEDLAREAAKFAAAQGPELVRGAVELLRRVRKSDDPKEALARALQVTAHEVAADAAVDALFAAKRKALGTGE